MKKIENKKPINYFVTKGYGETNIHNNGLASSKAYLNAELPHSVQPLNVTVLPGDCSFQTKMHLSQEGEMLHGMTAECIGSHGETISSGIMIGELVKKSSQKVISSLVVRLGSKCNETELKKRLKDALEELYEEHYLSQYELGKIESHIMTKEVEKELGSVVTAMCFSAESDHTTEIYPEFSSFMGKKGSLNSAKFVVLPAPINNGCAISGCGANNAVGAIFEASMSLEDYDLDSDRQTLKEGIFTEKPIVEYDPEVLNDSVKKKILSLLRLNKFPVLLGGDASVSLGAISAVHEIHPDVTVVQLDAFANLRPRYDGNERNEAAVITRAREITENIVQVGTNIVANREKGKLNYDKTFFLADIVGDEFWMSEVIEECSNDVYITLNASVFAPHEVNACRLSPGGLSYLEVSTLLKKLSIKKNIVGIDIVGFCPQIEAKHSEMTLAKLIYELISQVSMRRS